MVAWSMVAGFPVGPYSVARRFVAFRMLAVVLSIAAALACIFGYGYMAQKSASAILHDQEVWNAGGPELPAAVTGNVTTRQFVLKSYDLTVSFAAQDGTFTERKLEFDTLFGGMAEGVDTTVRLQPGSHPDFALNLAVEAATPRWTATAFYGVVGILLLGGAFGTVAYAAIKQYWRAARALRTGKPVACALISREPILHQGRPTGTETIKFKVPPQAPGASETEVSHQVRTKGSDVIVLGAGSAVLAIVPPESPRDAILILRNYYPLGLSDSERQQAEAALAGVLRG